MQTESSKMPRTRMGRLRRYLFTGLIIWIPLGVTIFVFQLFIGMMDQLVLVFPRS